MPRLLPAVLLLLLTACNTGQHHKNRNITKEAFSDMKTPAFVISPDQVAEQLRQLASNDAGRTEADRQTRSYYREGTTILQWIDRLGADHRADSLLAWLHGVTELGLTERSFCVDDIEQDLLRLRTLDFDEGTNMANHVAARLEYRLTKACLRYCYGQRFGFVNPHRLLNSLDIDKPDSLRGIIRYRQLFDIDLEQPTAHYAKDVLRKVRRDSIADYLRAIQPADPVYLHLQKLLPTATSDEQRRRIAVNMERSRWRCRQPFVSEGKRIVVNIPAYHLYAVSDTSSLDMRVVCGSRNTKTPLLYSNIEWMEVNPQWVIPMSIIRNEVARHAGDSAWFARHRYDIVNKETRQVMDAGSVSQQQLLSGRYNVAQRGGPGNSLGRIVFRFKNNFSVFLHDTNTPGAFQRESRSLSHGCVRVMKPFDLACFLLEQPDDWLLDRIRMAMGQAPETDQGRRWKRDHEDPDDLLKLIGYVGVKPRVPLYIIYYTLWPDENGIWQTWPDVYGYDQVTLQAMQPYMQ